MTFNSLKWFSFFSLLLLVDVSLVANKFSTINESVQCDRWIVDFFKLSSHSSDKFIEKLNETHSRSVQISDLHGLFGQTRRDIKIVAIRLEFPVQEEEIENKSKFNSESG